MENPYEFMLGAIMGGVAGCILTLAVAVSMIKGLIDRIRD